MKSHAQAYQDLFVLAMLDKKRDGTYLDVGCFVPVEGNNTALLREIGWNGLSIDNQAMDYGPGDGPFLCCDATKIYPQVAYGVRDTLGGFDYLSLDVDEATNAALPIALAFARYKVITIEHDLYARGKEQQQYQRDRIIGAGYRLCVPNVHIPDRPDLIFEDWYCSPEVDFEEFLDTPNDARKVVSEIWKNYFGEEMPT